MKGNPSLTVDDRVAPGTVTNLGLCSCCQIVATGIPADAKLLPIDEQQALLGKLQGYWKIIQLDIGSSGTNNTDVFVEGNVYTTSGGMRGDVSAPTEKHYFKFYRAGETLYSDRFGTRVISLDFAEFKYFSSVYGGIHRILWRREAAVADPKGDLVGEIAKLYKFKEQGILTEAEFSAAKEKLLLH
jgi:hypothetical protein